MDWLKKWWWLFAGAAGTIVSFLFGVFSKKSTPPVLEDSEKKTVEEDIAEREVVADTARDAQQADAQTEYAEKTTALIAEQTAHSAELADDADATNEFLKKTGEDIRGR